MNIKVLGDRILVQRDAEEEEGHILMPHAVKEKPSSGTVLSAGQAVNEIAVGNRVYFNKYAGYFLKMNQDLEESELIVMREDEVLAVELLEATAEVEQ